MIQKIWIFGQAMFLLLGIISTILRRDGATDCFIMSFEMAILAKLEEC